MSEYRANINWYPGHMTKARRMMEEEIKLIDVVIELVDGRVPSSSRNPDIDGIAGNKERVMLINKCDLADEKVTSQWIDYYGSKGFRTVKINSKDSKTIRKVYDILEELRKKKIEKDSARGIKNRPLRCMVVGIPNVGKSTFINSFAGKASAKTGNKPGVTKGKQWIRLANGIELLDTPGILWPKFDNEEVGWHLAFIGSINDEIVNLEELALILIDYIRGHYPNFLSIKYGIDETDREAVRVLYDIGVKRGCLKRGGSVDYEKTARLLFDDVRGGRVGLMSFETVGDMT
ncbi:MAG TPA: ribosome biogenesis GTPase YlqF [Eubacterium sp.]|nr:ribosome biogenesis GTPase YlqF [Eubacterium sp.]